MKLLASLLIFLWIGTGAAQGFPSRPVHVIVPFTPGTGADILARVLGPRLAERWKAPVVVENRTGATGNIGAEHVAKSAPDGHTLLLTATSFGTNPALTPSLPFHPVYSFAPIGLVATSALAVIANAQLPAASMRELIELARRQPGKLHYGSPGNGGVQHLAMELLKLEAGIDLLHVPYRGLGGMLSDLAAGHIQVGVSALQSAAPQVQAGKLRMLAVMGARRADAFPQVPTLRELGLSGLEVETWYAAFGPVGMPAAAVSRINADVNALLKEPSIRELLEKQGMLAAGGTPQEMGTFLDRELARWSRVVSAAKIKAD